MRDAGRCRGGEGRGDGMRRGRGTGKECEGFLLVIEGEVVVTVPGLHGIIAVLGRPHDGRKG